MNTALMIPDGLDMTGTERRALHDLLQQGAIAGGESIRYPATEAAVRLGVSRSTLWRALNGLSGRGYVETAYVRRAHEHRVRVIREP